MMFKCRVCSEKDKQIAFLEEQNKDLYDRLMSFNQDAFVYYKTQSNQGEPLYPYAEDMKGKRFSYKDTSPSETNEQVFRAMGEDPITVEENA
jgi:hypothetical protein